MHLPAPCLRGRDTDRIEFRIPLVAPPGVADADERLGRVIGPEPEEPGPGVGFLAAPRGAEGTRQVTTSEQGEALRGAAHRTRPLLRWSAARPAPMGQRHTAVGMTAGWVYTRAARGRQLCVGRRS